MPLNYNYTPQRMTQLFSRSLFIKYSKTERRPNPHRSQGYIGLDGNFVADDDDDNFAFDIEDDLVDAQLEPEVSLIPIELPDQFGQPDIGQDQLRVIMRERNNGPSFLANANVFQPFKKQFDIRSLKKQLWKEIEEKDEKHMSDVMQEIYSQNDSADFSIASAFICMLHLANEKTLEFKAVEEKDF